MYFAQAQHLRTTNHTLRIVSKFRREEVSKFRRGEVSMFLPKYARGVVTSLVVLRWTASNS